MPQRIDEPAVIEAAGNKPKLIQEFVGRVRTGTQAVSVARMRSPPGWEEPPQTPQFDEVTLVVGGVLRVESADGALDVAAGQALLARAGETVRYSTPGTSGAEYVAVCVPAFSPALVHRDPSPVTRSDRHDGSADANRAAPLEGVIQQVGVVRAPVSDTIDHGWGRVESTIELDPAFHGATRGLEEFSHAMVLYLLHRAEYVPERHRLRRPRGLANMPQVGIFSQRAKDRPSHIGVTTVELRVVRDDRLVVRGLDAVDGTPVLDIKPYYPAYDRVESPRVPQWVDRLMDGYF